MLPWHFLNPNGKLKLIFSGLPVSSSEEGASESPLHLNNKWKAEQTEKSSRLGSTTEAREQGKLLSPRLETQGIQ